MNENDIKEGAELSVNGCAVAAPAKRTWFERLMDRLYPRTYPAKPMNERNEVLPHFTQDTYIQLGWKERILVLFSGKILLSANTYTFDVVIQKALTQSTTSIMPPNYKFPKPQEQ